MREVLSLSYNAGTELFTVTVAAVKESEHVPGTFVRQLGVPEPVANHHVDDLPPELRDSFRALLSWLLEGTEKKHAEMAKDPETLAAAASALASRESVLRENEVRAREELAAHEAAMAAKKEEEAAAELALEERRAAIRKEEAELDARIAAKRSVAESTSTK